MSTRLRSIGPSSPPPCVTSLRTDLRLNPCLYLPRDTVQELWAAMKAIKDIIRGMISDSNTGVRTAVLKFLELQILAQSLKTTDSETKKSADGGLEIVPLRHPILDVSATDRSPAVNFPITIMPSHIHTLTHSLAHSLTLTHPSTHPPTPCPPYPRRPPCRSPLTSYHDTRYARLVLFCLHAISCWQFSRAGGGLAG